MTEDSEEQALLRSIVANPGEITPRLMLADLLAERGSKAARLRAEFIAKQVSLWDRYGAEFGAARHTDVDRCHKLLRGNFKLWWPDVAGRLLWGEAKRDGTIAGRDWKPFLAQQYLFCQYATRRGFVESLSCPAHHWTDHGRSIAASHPVRDVLLTTWPDPAHALYDPFPFGTPWADIFTSLWPSVRFTFPAGTPETELVSDRPIGWYWQATVNAGQRITLPDGRLAEVLERFDNRQIRVRVLETGAKL